MRRENKRTGGKAMFQYLAALIMILAFSMTAQAADCTCGKSTRPHSYHYDLEWITDAETHMRICQNCIANGHDEDCAQAVIVAKEAHTFTTKLNGRQLIQTCTVCGYTQAATCDHANAKWQVFNDGYQEYGYSTDETHCIKYCSDCLKIVDEKTSHNWAYKKSNTTWAEEYHVKYCKDCGYESLDSKHSFTYTYKKLPKALAASSDNLYASYSARHAVTKTCKLCGYSVSDGNEAHTFKSNKCTKCGIKREILKKLTSVKGKQTGKRSAKGTTPARWTWNGRSWIYYPAGTYTTYYYTVKVTWKKNKSAAGYVYSFDNNCIKAGDYLTDTFANAYGENAFTKKASCKATLSSTTKLKSTTLYIAAVNKYGFFGKVKKVKIKLK